MSPSLVLQRFCLILCTWLTLAGTAWASGMPITYAHEGTDYEGWFVSAGENTPLVLLLHDWDGLTDYEIKRADMLAKAGYSVFAADLFGKGIRPTEVKDKRQHTGALYQNRARLRALMQAAVKTAKTLGANTDNMVVMGYCFGGAAVLEYARSGAGARGFATFHGGLATPEGQDYQTTRAPILVMHGTADPVISMDQFASLAQQLEAAHVPHELITYGGAPHAFTVFDSPNYRKDADEKSWARFLGFLGEMSGK